MIKVISLDMDGTITESMTEISDKMANLLIKLSRDYNLAFISGGDLKQIKEQIMNKLEKKVKKKVYLFPTVGAKCFTYNNESYTPVYTHSLKPPEKRVILSAIAELIKKYDLKPLTSEEDQLQDRGSQISFSVLGRHADKKIKSEYDKDIKKRLEFRKYMQSIIPGFEITIGGTTSLDITKKGLNKAFAIKKLREITDCNFSEILYFGDRVVPGGNDYPVKTYVDAVNVDSIRDCYHQLRLLTKRWVCVSGGFSILHAGHIRLFKEAKKLGDKLVVIVNNDNWLHDKQGYVLIDEKERKEILESIKYVDKVFISIDQDKSVCKSLEYLIPEVFANGGDRFKDNIPEIKTCEENNIAMVFNVGGGKVNSSSKIVNKLRKVLWS